MQQVDLRRVFAAGLREVRPTAAAAADNRRQFLDQPSGGDAPGQIAGHRDDDGDLAFVVGRRHEHDAALDRALHRIGEAAQRILVEARRLGACQLHPARLDDVKTAPIADAAAHRQFGLELRHFARQLLGLALQLLDGLDGLILVDVQRGDEPMQRRTLLLRPGDGAQTSERLDSSNARRDPALGDGDEQSDVAGRSDVGAAAQFEAESGNRDDPHLVAVLLAEERHRPRGNRFIGGSDLGVDRGVLHDLFVDDALDAIEVVAADRLEVHEVEAQPVRRDERPGLFDMSAEHLAQRRVEQMCGGVIAAGRVANRRVDVAVTRSRGWKTPLSTCT